MATYIALLRGINVSGQKMIKMVELKAMFESIGLEAVQTYIQSGNVLFQSVDLMENEMVEKIHSAILERFGFEVDVQVFTVSNWNQIIANNPFVRRDNLDEAKLYVTLLAKEPLAEDVEKLASFAFQEETYQLIERAVYLYVPKGYGNAKLSNNFLENKLKVSATTRNWKTMLTLRDML
ncbi:DUF1697 domain-containing protein [Aquirufa aurantiipilula]|uniref:DUF1697 domain-containing protein n=1 Tax=Aquirufa aurantiipilula TaxID=2696561 RepID=A0ABT6BFZ5_9BACT|nr:DUF1697 domain-containing protein [Aquirufa aurantiipilula]MBZ1327145.1 DUF1697 domain-containing protein [Aquirufa aurantiipilula]MDF5689289.1 DUF1697 domain-containing protein [Aquirufa aurantiipilula]